MTLQVLMNKILIQNSLEKVFKVVLTFKILTSTKLCSLSSLKLNSI